MKTGLTIAIPTYNRTEILGKALSHYSKLSEIDKSILMVIDNNLKDYNGTYNCVHKYINNGLEIKYIREYKVGLSSAKNRAIKECTTSHILFLDDDCYPDGTIISECFKWIGMDEVGFVVGKVCRWDEEVEPWIHNDLFIHNQPTSKCENLLSPAFINGGIMLINLKMIGNKQIFDLEFGMKGDETRYGEDTRVYNLFKERDLKMKYDPSIIMYHSSHQSSFLEFLISFYWRGVSWHKNSIRTCTGIILALLSSIVTTPKTFLRYKNKASFQALLLLMLRNVVVNFGSFVRCVHHNSNYE